MYTICTYKNANDRIIHRDGIFLSHEYPQKYIELPDSDQYSYIFPHFSCIQKRTLKCNHDYCRNFLIDNCILVPICTVIKSYTKTPTKTLIVSLNEPYIQLSKPNSINPYEYENINSDILKGKEINKINRVILKCACNEKWEEILIKEKIVPRNQIWR